MSTEDQAERETIQGQLDFLRRYVALHELPVAGEYVDDGVSGAIPLGDRPDGRRLLAIRYLLGIHKHNIAFTVPIHTTIGSLGQIM